MCYIDGWWQEQAIQGLSCAGLTLCGIPGFKTARNQYKTSAMVQMAVQFGRYLIFLVVQLPVLVNGNDFAIRS